MSEQVTKGTNQRGTKDTKRTVKLINLKQTDNAMAKKEKRQSEKQQYT